MPKRLRKDERDVAYNNLYKHVDRSLYTKLKSGLTSPETPKWDRPQIFLLGFEVFYAAFSLSSSAFAERIYNVRHRFLVS